MKKASKKRNKNKMVDDLGMNLSYMGPSQNGEKGFEVELVGDAGKGKNILQVFAAHFLAMLDEAKAENYLEMQAGDAKNKKRCVVTIQRFAHKTPHAFRMDAERERDKVKADNEDLQKRLNVALETIHKMELDKNKH